MNVYCFISYNIEVFSRSSSPDIQIGCFSMIITAFTRDNRSHPPPALVGGGPWTVDRGRRVHVVGYGMTLTMYSIGYTSQSITDVLSGESFNVFSRFAFKLKMIIINLTRIIMINFIGRLLL